MPDISAYAPGKCILLGEHAVVYNRPAIAVPIFQVKARAAASANIRGKPGSIHFQAPDIRLDADLNQLPRDNPLRLAAAGVLAALQISSPPAVTLRITSTIPIAAGLGSGAAVSVALIRAFSSFLGHPLPDAQVNALAFEIEKRHHGTPSGIDNTVITYGLPVYFIKGQAPLSFRVPVPFTLIIGDTGVRSPTGKVVGDVRLAWQANSIEYEAWFDQISRLVVQGYDLIQSGKPLEMGPLFNQNHTLLQQVGVSSPELDRLVDAARAAGAAGAKLSGSGRGGNMIALADLADAPQVAAALQAAGAVRTFVSEINPK